MISLHIAKYARQHERRTEEPPSPTLQVRILYMEEMQRLKTVMKLLESYNRSAGAGKNDSNICCSAYQHPTGGQESK